MSDTDEFSREPDPWALSHNDNPVCPHCLSAMDDAWELGMADGDVRTEECDSCGKSYEVECYVSRTYSTRKEAPHA